MSYTLDGQEAVGFPADTQPRGESISSASSLRWVWRPLAMTIALTFADPGPTSSLTFLVDRVDDVASTSGCSDAVPVDCSLRTAITLANANPGPDTIQLPAALTLSLTIAGALEDLNQTGDLDVLGDLTVLGHAAQRPTIDAKNGAYADAVFDVHVGASLTMRDVHVMGSNEISSGGRVVHSRFGADALVLERVQVEAPAGIHDAIRADADSVLLRELDIEAEANAIRAHGSAELQLDVLIEDSFLTGTIDVEDAVATIENTVILAIGTTGVLTEGGVTDLSIIGSTVFNGLSNNHGLERGVNFEPLDGNLLISHSEFSYGFETDGGAVNVWRGTADIRHSTFSNNTAERGGAVAVGALAGAVLIDGCTFVDNVAPGASGLGGAVSTESPSLLSILNSTFTSNQARFGGALWVSAGAHLALANVTVSGNAASAGTAVFVNGTTTVSSSLIHGSCSGTGTTTSFGGNLESPGATCGFVQAFDQQNIADPLLGPLQADGGPTEVMVPQPGSAAIDHLPFCGLPTDQRGGSRPAGATSSPLCDVGAVEVGSLEIFADGFESGNVSSWTNPP